MPVTIVFYDGRIMTFPGADAVDKQDSSLLVSRLNPSTGCCESLGTFVAKDVSIAQIFEHGVTKALKAI